MRMKVVMLEYFLPGNTYTLELCKKLGEICDVTLICKNNYHTTQKLNFSLENILHSSSNGPVSALKGYLGDLRKILKIVKRVRPDVFHVQGIVHQSFETILMKVIHHYVPRMVFTAHNILSHEEKKNEKEKLYRWYQLFDGIVVHNEASRTLFDEYTGGNHAVCVMPHGAYTGYDIKQVAHDKLTFLTFGIVREYKGVDILLNAVALLPDQVKERIQVIIAGKQLNSYNIDLEKIVRQNHLESCVDLMIRRIGDDELPDLFGRADACIFPYRQIYGSGALLMAYAFEKPVIASDIPVFVEETENGSTGCLFSSEDPQKLSSAIIRFASMTVEERDKLKQNVIKLRDGKYNWANSAKVLRDFYLSLIAD